MVWPDGEDFVQLVATAVKDRRSNTAVLMRDALAGREIVGRTVDALETVIARIDEQLDTFVDASEEQVERRESARAGMYDWLVWYRQVQVLHGDVGG